ncbi:hypothetical protein, partial [Paenibacillus taiwanensis]|uniref:hypothetical protein n=1 Tax=Paenibacillus taiwanensis TaxID=401638 RepID=UPI000562F511
MPHEQMGQMYPVNTSHQAFTASADNAGQASYSSGSLLSGGYASGSYGSQGGYSSSPQAYGYGTGGYANQSYNGYNGQVQSITAQSHGAHQNVVPQSYQP